MPLSEHERSGRFEEAGDRNEREREGVSCQEGGGGYAQGLRETDWERDVGGHFEIVLCWIGGFIVFGKEG